MVTVTYNWKLRVSFPVGEESVGAQVVLKAPAEDKRRQSAEPLKPQLIKELPAPCGFKDQSARRALTVSRQRTPLSV